MAGLSFRASLFALVAAIAVPSVAASQGPGALNGNDLAPPETVVVTGHGPAPQKLDTIVPQFVAAHGKLSKIGQLARWRFPVCPETKGLPPGFNAFITARIKAIAASVGAPTREPCDPNIEIIFTGQAQLYMNSVAARYPWLLGMHFVHQTRDLATVTRPIQAWYITSTSGGVQTHMDEEYPVGIAFYSGPASTYGSRIAPGLQTVLSHVLILADTDRLAGSPVGPVADYLAMLALSQNQAPSNCAELPSILDLLSPDCTGPEKPLSLTVADKAYLEGLYAMNLSQTGSLQRSSVSEHMIQGFRVQ